MKDERKTREQLLHELSALRQRNAELEEAEAGHIQTEDVAERKQMEQPLGRERLLGDSLIENIPAGIAFLDNDFVLLRCSRAYANLIETYTPYTPQQALGMSYFDCVPGSREQVEEWFRAVRDSGQAQTGRSFELTIMRDGQEQTTWWDISAAPVPGPTGAVEGILVFIQDVTERVRAEEALQESEEKTRALLNAAIDSAGLIDSAGIVLAANKAYADSLGKGEDEVIGKCIRDLYPPDVAELRKARIDEVFSTGEPVRFVDSRERRTFDNHVYPILGPGRETTAVAVYAREITEHKLTEHALTTERNLLRTLIDNLPDPTYFKDTDSCFVAGNMAVAQIMGAKTPDQLLGKTDFDFYPQELAERFYADERQVIQSGQPLISQEEPVTDPTGTVRWFSTTKVPLRDERGNVVGVVGIGRDISEQRRAEAALRESEAKYRAVVERANDGIIVIQDSLIRYANPQGAAIVGCTVEGVLDVPFERFLPPDVRDEYLERYRRRMKGEPAPHTYESSLLRKGGGTVDVEINAGIVEYESRPANLVFVRDITERKRTEEALRRSEERFRGLFEQAPDAIFINSEDDRILNANPAACQLLGYTRDQLLTMTVPDLVAPEMRQPVGTTIKSELERGGFFETLDRHRDGHLFPVEVRTSRLIDEDEHLVLSIVRDTSERKQAEEELQRSLSRTQLLNQVIAATASTLDFSTVLEAVCQGLAVGLDIPQAAFALLDADKKQLTVVAEYRAQGRPSALGAVIPVTGNQATQYVLEHRTPLVIGDAQTDPRQAVIHDLERQRGTVSLLIVPLMIRDQVIGTLGLDATELREFTPEEIDLVQNVAAAAGQALENAQLHEAVQKELAERKQAEERLRASLREKEVLLTEIHHRVKNNLQVVSSLLDLQADTVQDADAYQAFHDTRARVKSMALIHERLYQSSDLARIDAGEYIQEMLEYLLGAYGVGAGDITASVQADEVALGIDTAIPCGLIITELVSNALRHAFPAEETAGQGEIRVELRRLDGQLCLVVSDNGVGLPPDFDFYGTESLGLQLVNILVDQLDGTLEVEGGTSPAGKRAGTTVKIAFAQYP
jgi:PAS domain S-box-containing protein